MTLSMEVYPAPVRTDDRLTSKLDKWLFFIIFIIGTSLIALEKGLVAPRWVAPLTGGTAIVVFCLLSWKVARFRLREDRIGDGAYYLGFLFTLISVAFALYQFTERGGTEGVISGFGVALTTTIVGLALRVVFQQLREDPIEIEQEIRRTLSHEVMRLEREIRISVESMALLRTRTEKELHNAVGAGLKEMLKDSRDAMFAEAESFKATVLSTLEGVTWAVGASKEQAGDTKRTSARLIKALDSLAQQIEEIKMPTDGLQKQLDGVAAVVERIISNEWSRTEATKKSADSILSVYKEMESLALSAAGLMEDARKSIEGIHESVRHSASAADEMVGTARKVTDDLVERSRKQLEWFERVDQMNVQQEAALKGLRHSLEEHVEASANALIALQSNVMGASELIVRELSAK